MTTQLLVATDRQVLRVDAGTGVVTPSNGLGSSAPTCLTVDSLRGIAWCGTQRDGVFRSDDGGASWVPGGLAGEKIMALTASTAEPDLLWVGTEPSAVWRSEDGGATWHRTTDVTDLPSSPRWAFPPRPDTHHVRWIASHPSDPDRLWVAIEAGALISTIDGGRTWRDRVDGGPYDTHELAIHPAAPDTLRSAAGDGYFESRDAGRTWESPEEGLEVRYLRSITMDPGDPEVVVVSAASHPYKAYGAGSSDGRLFRRQAGGRWTRVTDGWPDPPNTIAPLLAAGAASGELWAADERGVHASSDGGITWRQVARFEPTPRHLRGVATLG
jgi:photosystem II stability/assembly factor-like uncharacterized protein